MIKVNYDGEKVEKEVKKRVEESLAQAKKMTSLIRERQKGELKPKEEFFDAIFEAQKELDEALAFLKRAESTPAILFAEASRYLISTRGMVYTIMNHVRTEDGKIKGHDFQVYLADLANRYFQQWLRERDIPDDFAIQIRDANYFPSNFAIYHGDRELIQFNLIEKWYGVRKRPLSKETILLEDSKQAERLLAAIRKQEKSLVQAIHRRDYPRQYVKGVKHSIRYFFSNKKKLDKIFDDAVKKEEAILIQYKMEMEQAKILLPEIIENAQETATYLMQVEPFFQDIGYVLETEKNKLY